MALGIHAIEGVADLALLVDNEGGTLHGIAHDTIHLLLDHDVVGPTGLHVLVRQETDGNALLVWTNADSKDNNKGAVYGAELVRQPDGSYIAGSPFLISAKSGSNQRPHVVYLEAVNKFLIAWDTSYYDLNEFRKFDHIADRPLPGSKILARTYVPSFGKNNQSLESRLGKITVIIVSAIRGDGSQDE